MDKLKTGLYTQINDWLDKTFSPNGKKLFVVIIVLMLAAGGYFAYTTLNSAPNAVEELDIVTEEITPKEEVKKTEEIDMTIDPDNDVMVSIPVEDVGRADPFLPYGESTVVTRQTSMHGYSLLPPPEGLIEGSDASKVMTTKVSGILYDAKSPSAILNIEGNDYLVRTGDYIHKYKVLSISKDLVTVQLDKNVYKAGVGQLMTDITLNYNTVYDLQHRFGGAKK